MTDTKPYVLVLTLSTQDHAELPQQLKSGFERTNKWNKYRSKVLKQALSQYLIT